MGVNLIVARCGRSPLLMGDVEALSAEDRDALEDGFSMDEAAALAQVLPSGRRAVGLRDGVRCAWWVTDEAFLDELDPPHALWAEPTLFVADGEGEVPDQLALEPRMLALQDLGGAAHAAKVVAGAIRTLRETRGPVAVVTECEHATRVALSLVVVAVMGRDLSVAVSHPAPPVSRYRFVVVGPEARLSEDYTVIDATDPPDEGDDLVAWFARDRLRSDPQALVVSGGVSDAAVRAILREGEPQSELGREGAMRLLLARLRARAPLDEALLAEVVQATLKTNDPRPWLELAKRSSAERERAVLALLSLAPEMRPSTDLLDAVGRVYPRGASLGPWCAALLDWMRRSREPAAFLHQLEAALLEWPQAATQTNRASIWTEVVRILVQREQYSAALDALSGPVAMAMIRDNTGSALAAMWGSVPPDRRNPRRLSAVIDHVARVPEGDVSAARFYTYVKSNAAEVDGLVKAWVRSRGMRGVQEDDALFRALAGTEHLSTWLQVAMEVHSPAAVVPLLTQIATGPEDPVWLDAESALAHEKGPLERFVALKMLSSGRSALEPLARGVVGPALDMCRFPDAGVSETARMFIDVEGSTEIWPWIAISAAAPGRHADDVLDGTVVDLCTHPPTNAIDRSLCFVAAERLGGAGEWVPLDHARWIVRFALAPDGDHTGFSHEVARWLVSGLAGRFDAGPHLAGVLIEMFQLPVDHLALTELLGSWLPAAWAGRVPASFVEAVEQRGVPAALQAPWTELVT